MILLCQLVHLYTLLLGPANFELRFTIDLVLEKTIVNSFVMFFLAVNSFATSLPRVDGDMVLFLFFSSAVSSTMATLFLDHVVRDREKHPVLVYETFFWIRCQPRIVRNAVHNYLIPTEKAFRALHFRNCFA